MASCDSTSSGGVDAEDAWSVHQSMLEHQPEQELAAARPRGRRREAPGRRRQGCWGGTHCAALTAALLVAAAVLLPQAPSQSVSREGRGSVVSLTANAASDGVDPDVPVPTANMKMDMLVAKVLALRSKLEDLHRQVVGLETGLRACAGAPGMSPIVCATVDDVCCNGLCCGPDAICCGPAGAQICCSHGSRCCSEVALCLDSNTSCPASTAPASDWPKLPMSAGGIGVATAPEIEFKTERLLNGTSSGNDSSNATAAAELPSADNAIESLPTPSSEAEPALENGSKESDTASEDAPAAAPPPAVGDVQEMLRVAPPEAATARSSASGDDGTSSTRDAKVQEAASPLDSATGGDGTSSSTTVAAVQKRQAFATKEAAAALDGTADGDVFSPSTTASEGPQSQPPATTEATPAPDGTTSGAETHESQAPLTEEVAALPDSTSSGDGASASTTAPETRESQASPTKEAAPAPASTTSGNGTSSSTTAPETHERQASPTQAAPALGGLGAAESRSGAASPSSRTSGASQPLLPPPALGEEEMLRAAASEAETPHEDEGTLGSGISSTTTAGVQPDVGGVRVIQVGPSEAEVRKEKAMANAVPPKASTNRENTTVTGSKHDAMEQVM